MPEDNSLTESNASNLESAHQMRMDWRDRIQVLFSNQNPDTEPLPSWAEVPTRPSEPWAIEQWERDNVMRSYWANRLNGGYIQTNIVIRESPYDSPEDYQYSSTDEYYSLDWFNEGYQMIEPTKESLDVFEQEDLGLERLFSEN